jgi:hypothetical protein
LEPEEGLVTTHIGKAKFVVKARKAIPTNDALPRPPIDKLFFPQLVVALQIGLALT